jgi:hypothetical protein
MIQRRTKKMSKARNAVAWGIFLFFGIQFGVAIAMEHLSPQWRDPEYGYKLRELKDRLREEPDRPLLLVIGSSRSGLGVCPADFHLRDGDNSKAPIVFNMAISGSGPLFELMSLNRVLSEGIHPRWVMVEVLPPLLYQEPAWSEWQWLNINRLSSGDLALLSRYSDNPKRLKRHWLLSRLAPSYSHRFYLMGQYFPAWLPLDLRNDAWWQIDGYGYRTAAMPDVVEGPTRDRLVMNAHREYFHALQNFKVAEKSKRAMDEFMQTCRANNLPVLVYLMPEGEVFRSWYKAGTAEAIDAYLASLKHDYNVEVVDSRRWLEERCFFDSHHLLQPGAHRWSTKFGQEYLQPWLATHPAMAQVNHPTRLRGMVPMSIPGGAAETHSP